MNRILILIVALAAGLAGCSSERPVNEIDCENPRTEPWSQEVVDAFGALPVQADGRVKPLSTYVGFKLYAINGKRSWTLEEGTGLPTAGETLDPVRWALDVAFHGEQAQHYECFLVNDKKALEQIGLDFPNRKRRDRFSYAQLSPGRSRLDQLAARAREKDAKVRTTSEVVLLQLQQALFHFDVLQEFAASAVASIGPDASERVRAVYSDADPESGLLPLGTALLKFPELAKIAREIAPDGDAGSPAMQEFSSEIATLSRSLETIGSEAMARALPAVLPPPDESDEVWRNAGEAVIGAIRSGEPPSPRAAATLDQLGRAFIERGDPAARDAALLALGEVGRASAEARGVLGDIEMERDYYDRRYFLNALALFGLGLVCVLFGFVLPRVKPLSWAAWGSIGAALALVVTGLTVRCILLDRPPVATLYETILFITAGGVLSALLAEWATRYRIGLTAAAVMGLGGMFLALRFEAQEAISQGDTMGGLVAVLNSNFWLATHVTTVTLGYSAGLFAALLGHGWIVIKLINSATNNDDPEVAKLLRAFGRMLYGVVCFGLVLSTVGTILGGVWANDSWGRFWGWDPKENGALMIVLYQLVIVHSRLGGYIKDFGVAVLAVIGGAIVAFSWFHVNQLGVGLHSYGFTDGVVGNLYKYYSFVALFSLAALVAYPIFIDKSRKVGPA